MEEKRKANIGEYVKVIRDDGVHTNHPVSVGKSYKVTNTDYGLYNTCISTGAWLSEGEYVVVATDHNNSFNKSDLRTGMVVEDRDGWTGVVLLNTATLDGIKWFISGFGDRCDVWEELDEYSDDLFHKDSGIDIIKIFQPHNFNDYTTIKAHNEEYLIWEREEKIKEVTIKDIEEKFGCKVRIVS